MKNVNKLKIKYKFVFIILFFLYSSCSDKIEYSTTYWNSNSKQTNKIRYKYRTVNEKLDGYCYRYYDNGQIMSKALYKEDRLVKIFYVFDSNGNKLNFGNINKEGTGYVITYSDFSGTRLYSGYYIKGRREGWWKDYLYEGASSDSIFYDDSHPDYMPALNDVMY